MLVLEAEGRLKEVWLGFLGGDLGTVGGSDARHRC